MNCAIREPIVVRLVRRKTYHGIKMGRLKGNSYVCVFAAPIRKYAGGQGKAMGSVPVNILVGRSTTERRRTNSLTTVS